MSETEIQHTPIRRRTRRSDGSAGRPVAAPAPVARAAVNTPGAPNSALKEPAAPESEQYRYDHPAAAHIRVVDPVQGIIEPSGRKKFAICGFASSSRGYIPVNDPTWEIWGLNQLYRHIPRADRWFDIHVNWNEENVPGTDHEGWLRSCGIPFYMSHRIDAPNAVRYPVERLIAKFNDYFTSTIAFMIALAVDEIDQAVDARIANGELVPLCEGGKRMPVTAAVRALYSEYVIGIFGVDLIVGEEYFWQKCCAEWWIGIACSRGIQLALPKETALCKQLYRYGYQREPDSHIKVSELASFSQKMTKERDELLRQLYMRDGALQASEQMKELLELRLRGAEIAPRF